MMMMMMMMINIKVGILKLLYEKREYVGIRAELIESEGGYSGSHINLLFTSSFIYLRYFTILLVPDIKH